MTRILHAITSLRIGGAEKLITEIVPLIAKAGYEVDVLAIDGMETYLKSSLENLGIKVISFDKYCSPYQLKFIPQMIKLMRDYDIVHTHITATQYYAAIGSYFCRAKMVTTEHATSNRRRRIPLFKYLDRWMYSRYDRIINISKPCYENLKNYIGEKFPFCIIKNGINTSRFINAEPIDLGIGDYIKMTMVAGFRYEKDQSTIIRSLNFLPENIHLILVGDGEKRQELVNLVNEENVGNRVHFMGVREDIPQILKSSDIIVMSSHREGLSLSNIEGMCSGHPFIASDVEGLKEVTDGYGLLFPHQDFRSFAEMVKSLITNKEYAQEIAYRCQNQALKYDIRITVDSYIDVYKELM